MSNARHSMHWLKFTSRQWAHKAIDGKLYYLQARQQYHRELGMLIKEAEFERSELIVEMFSVYEIVKEMRVRPIALSIMLRCCRMWQYIHTHWKQNTMHCIIKAVRTM